MLASLEEPPIAKPGLFYEPKYDGIRALVDLRPAVKRGAVPAVAIYSRNGNEKTRQFPAITAALAAVGRAIEAPLLIDGEIVAIDPAGRPMGFQDIQGRIHLTGAPEIDRAERDQPTALLMFDLLRDGDEDLRGQALAARRLRLQERVRLPRSRSSVLRLSEMVADDGRELLARARREGWEGLIAKDGGSPYHSGRRTPAWRKLKLNKQQEFVVGGWTDPRQTRSHFGSLLLGYYDAGGELRWAGMVGTGFDQKELDRVSALLDQCAMAKSPFADAFKTMERAHWVRPDLVVEVRFTEWTSDGMLRHPVYLGMRGDKKARDVKLEEVPKVPGVPRVPKVRGPRHFRRSGVRIAREEPADVSALVRSLETLEHARKDGDIILPNGDKLRVTNLAKVLWPGLKVTKGELLRYYAAVSPLLRPVIDDRPMVMKRFPNGIDKQAFYQQRHPEATPPGVRREVLPEDIEPISEEGPRDRLIGGSLTTLLYMTQLASISQDPWFSRVAEPIHQDHAAIDLDPGEGAGFSQVLDVARWVKDELDRLGIPGVPKTSGSRGLHIYVPLPPGTTYETGQLLCHMVATLVSEKHPKVATIERWVKRRPRGTVYVDYLQNILGKTLATAYSVRATDYAGVSTPLSWKEVTRDLDPRAFTIRTTLDRFKKVGDLWAPVRTGPAVNLKAVLRKLR